MQLCVVRRIGCGAAVAHATGQPAGLDFHKLDLKTGLREDWLGNDGPTAVSEVGTFRCRALHSNHMAGHVWQEYGSETLRAQPPDPNVKEPGDGGRGYYRNISLLNLWAHAPFLHNNALGPELCGKPQNAANDFYAQRPRYVDASNVKLLPAERQPACFEYDPSVEGRFKLYTLSMQALLNNGDEVLIPAPDYPLWTAAVSLAGGKPVHYLCDEQADWFPDLEDIKAKITSNTKALVIINPNNPTGAVYSRELLLGMLELARQHNLVVFSDEIYDKILYDDAVHICTASLAPDLLCLTFNGLSKSYRVAGFRSGWLALSGPKQHAQSYIEGIDMLANMRLCANVPSQHAIQTALGGYQSINDLVLPNGRLLEQRNRTWELLNDIPGVSCVKPMGALYAFPKIDPKVCPIHNDEKFVLDLLLSEKLLIVQGTAFNWPWPDHFRVVTLPRVDDLEQAIGRIGNFLKTYSQ